MDNSGAAIIHFNSAYKNDPLSPSPDSIPWRQQITKPTTDSKSDNKVDNRGDNRENNEKTKH